MAMSYNPTTDPIPYPEMPEFNEEEGNEEAKASAEAAAKAAEEAAKGAATEKLLNQTDKILRAMQTPQAIRELPQFDGNPVKLHCFIRAVENLMPFLSAVKDTPFEQVWLQSIRSKITGEADQVLEIYGTPLNWTDIKSNLIAYYNDKRDPVTLTRELFQLYQHGTIEEFYSRVQQTLSLLINHTNIFTDDVNVRTDRTQTHQQNALQVFLAGLKEPIGGNVRARVPKTLKMAFDAAIEERNFQNRHTARRMDLTPRYSKFNTNVPPQLPPQTRPRPQTIQPFNQQPRPYFPTSQSAQIRNHQAPPRNYNNNPFIPRHQTPNVFAPRPIQLDKPVPMEIDPSIRSRQINYMNRPQRQINYHENYEHPDQYFTDDHYGNHSGYSTIPDNYYYNQLNQYYSDPGPTQLQHDSNHNRENVHPRETNTNNQDNQGHTASGTNNDEINFQIVQPDIGTP